MDKDLIREKILESLFEIQNNARSRTSQLVGIRDLSRQVKTHLEKVKENEVASNVTFLVQNGLVEEIPVENFYASSRFGNSKPSYKYRLTREGLAYFEHGSKYDRSNVFAGIGDVSGDGNFIVVGNSNNITNLTNSKFVEGHKLVEDLRRRINALGELTDSEKINIQSDLETIKSQLVKDTPDKTIIEKSKENVSFLANIVTIAPYAKLLFDWLSQNIHF